MAEKIENTANIESIENLAAKEETDEKNLKVTFAKPVKWEDREYKEIDLTPIESLTGRQLCEIHKRFDVLGNASAIKEQNPEFAAIVASTVTSIPIEFFYDLPAKELNKIKNKVFSYFFTED